jgi:pyridinium-3,5-bisthiocarboxylic acid mononucleotide nickel chelatase
LWQSGIAFFAVPIAILDPFSGISGDMTLAALIDVGLDPEWLRGLPGRLGLEDVEVDIAHVRKNDLACAKVDFRIPVQPHGRHLREIRAIIQQTTAPATVKNLANAAFTAIAEAEAQIHGIPPERVHLHEVGAVDAILDVMGSVWGMSELGVSTVYCGTISLGDGFVHAAHGVLPVPAPATLKLLEGLSVRPGPEGTGELVTPTGAALVRVLASGAPPARYVPRRSGFGAGTRDLPGRPNALRVVLAELDAADADVETLVLLTTDVDDMSPEHLANAADTLRLVGALDVTMSAVQMKKGRLGTRIETLCRVADRVRLEDTLFGATSTIGVRRSNVERCALHREERQVRVLGHDVRVKVVTLPDGAHRAKPQFDDLRAVSDATGRSLGDISSLALSEAERGQ